jgi:hypothetical protein
VGNQNIQHYPTELLDPRQLHAADLLARSVSKASVAKQVGVDRTTVYEWLKQPGFSRELRQRRERLTAVIDNQSPYLTGLMHWQESLPRVMQSVVDVACDPTHRNQLRAAELILEHLRPEHIDRPPSEDARVVAEYAQSHGWRDGTG